MIQLQKLFKYNWEPQIPGKQDRIESDYVPLDPVDYSTTLQTHIIAPIDFEALFAASPGAVIVNNNDLTSKCLADDFTKHVYSRVDGEIGFTASCECDSLYSQDMVGTRCPKCGSVVSNLFVNHLAHVAWLGIPEEFPAMLHPFWYCVLSKCKSIYGKGKVSLFDMLVNADIELPDHLNAVIKEQSFAYFHAHHEEIFNYLLYEMPARAPVRKELAIINSFYIKYKHLMFTRKYPILHSSLHPLVKSSGTRKLADKTPREFIESIVDMSTLTYSIHHTLTSPARVEKSLLKIFKNIMEYYDGIIKEKISTKRGILRFHNLGSRLHASFRTVCLPISGPHEADTVRAPWKLMVNSLKLQIINRLVRKYFYTLNDALVKHMGALVVYDKDIHKIMLDLMEESPWKGFPICLGRNPRYLCEQICGPHRSDLMSA